MNEKKRVHILAPDSLKESIQRWLTYCDISTLEQDEIQAEVLIIEACYNEFRIQPDFPLYTGLYALLNRAYGFLVRPSSKEPRLIFLAHDNLNDSSFKQWAKALSTLCPILELAPQFASIQKIPCEMSRLEEVLKNGRNES